MEIYSRLTQEEQFRADVVRRILDGRAEEALRLLSEHFNVSAPKLRVGTVKGHRQVLGCYVQREGCIYLSSSNYLMDPFVVLHEFYHHLRASGIRGPKQAEKRADRFALGFLRDFHLLATAQGGT